MKPIHYFTVIFIALISLNAQAQPRVLAMSVETIIPAGDTTEYGVPMIDSTTLFNTVMQIVLAGTDSIYQVHVKLGSTEHGSQYLSTSFDYGIDGTFGTTSYSQTANVIVLGLGDHPGMINFFADLQIEKTDHTLEEAVLFSNN